LRSARTVREERDIAAAVRTALLRHPHVIAVELVGSRARGTPSPLSDWDFTVEVNDVAGVTADMPALVTELEPFSQQWDRLGPDDYCCYMLMLAGPVKIDLIFPGVPHRPEPPWEVAPDTLDQIDQHFWDWVLWMAAKEQSGKGDLVRQELTKMSEHLLRPMDVDRVPRSIHAAIVDYLSARERLESALGVHVSRRLELEVLPVLHRAVGVGLDLRTHPEVE
jgi:predicted nucleotidyltransferase